MLPGEEPIEVHLSLLHHVLGPWGGAGPALQEGVVDLFPSWSCFWACFCPLLGLNVCFALSPWLELDPE